MNAGLLKDVIEVHYQTSQADIYGGDSTVYTMGFQTKARVFVDKKDREISNYSEEFPTIVTFNIRLYHKLQHTDRIKWNGDMYRILSVFPDKTRQLIEIKTSLIKE